MMSALVCGVAAASIAQAPGLRFEIDYGPGRSAVSPDNPSCRVRVLAAFPREDFAFARGHWDVLGAEPGWSEHTVLAPFFVGSNPGTISWSDVIGIMAGQPSISFPPTPINPAPLWEATWSASNFTPRTVRLDTVPYRFDVYYSPNTPGTQSRLSILVPSFGEITVVPAPGAIAALAALPLLRRRRRGARVALRQGGTA